MVSQEIDADATEVEVRLPATGKLRTHFESFPSLAANWGELFMHVTQEGHGELLRSEAFASSASGGWDLKARLLPGSYSVHLTFCSDRGAIGNTATRTLSEGRVTVVAGEETLIVVSGGADPRASLISR